MDEPAGSGGDAPLRMIATDIDGTMLRSDGSLSPRVKGALAAAVEAGLHVVPATGRPVIISADVIDRAELDDYWVFANGAITRHIGRDELVRGFWMDHEVTRDLLGLLRREMPDCGFAIELEDTVAFEAGSLQFGWEPPIDVEPGDIKRHAFAAPGAYRVTWASSAGSERNLSEWVEVFVGNSPAGEDVLAPSALLANLQVEPDMIGVGGVVKATSQFTIPEGSGWLESRQPRLDALAELEFLLDWGDGAPPVALEAPGSPEP